MTKLEQVARAIFASWRKQMDDDGLTGKGTLSFDAMDDNQRRFGMAGSGAEVELTSC